MALQSHVLLHINNTCSMIIGGSNYPDFYASTFYFDHNNGDWINGSKLIQARSFHAAGIVTDELTNEKFAAVTGGVDGHVGVLDSIEILIDDEWISGIKINVFKKYKNTLDDFAYPLSSQ